MTTPTTLYFGATIMAGKTLALICRAGALSVIFPVRSNRARRWLLGIFCALLGNGLAAQDSRNLERVPIDIHGELVPARPVAVLPCKTVLESSNGSSIRAGRRVTLDLVDRQAAGGRATYVPGDTRIHLPPDGAFQGRSTPPKVVRVLLAYTRIVLPSSPDNMAGGWFADGGSIFDIKDFDDHGDGTVSIDLPEITNGTETTPGLLSLKTDTCNVAGPVNVGPKSHYGRWFPPAIMTVCGGRGSGLTFPTGGIDIARTHFVTSRANIEGRRDKTMMQFCAAYGAVHEGGRATGNSGGRDEVIVWTGDRDAKLQVLSSCPVQVSKQPAEAQDYMSSLAFKKKISKAVSSTVVKLGITWQILEPHGYCQYAIVARGQHSIGLTDHLYAPRTGSHDSSGIEYAMGHFSDRSEIYRRVRDSDGRYTTTVATLRISDAE